MNAVRKVERVQEIGNSINERLKPLLNPDQLQKFDAVREQLRRRAIAKAAGEAKQKVESEVKSWFTDKSVK